MSKTIVHWGNLIVCVGLSMATTSCLTASDAPAEEAPVSVGSQPLLTFEEFKHRVPYDEKLGAYIVEWDKPLMGEQALRDYYDAAFGPPGALLIEQYSEADSKWNRTDRWNLSYCIAKSEFGTNYTAMGHAMRRAGAAWENTADVRFPHDSAQDNNCTASNNNVMFEVHATSGQSYEAVTGFIPSDPRRYRLIYVNSSAFTSEMHLTDVMTHELGHVLGFKHEHVQNPASRGICLDDIGDYRKVTGYDGLSVMHYPSCPGTLVTNGRLTISQRDIEGAQSIYDAPTNVVHCNGILYARKRGTGELYRYDPSSGTWVWFDIADQAIVCSGGALYTQDLNAGGVWQHYYSWKKVADAVGQIMSCPGDRVCATNIDPSDTVTGGSIHWIDFSVQSWSFIGGPGSKFAATYNTLLGIGPKRDYVAIYNGTDQNWSVLPGGGALDLVGTGNLAQYVYRTTLDGQKLQRFTGSRTNPWTDIYSGQVTQWRPWSVWLYAIGLSGYQLYRHASDGTRTLIDNDSVRAYIDTTYMSNCLFVTDNAENIWKWCHNPDGWTGNYGHP